MAPPPEPPESPQQAAGVWVDAVMDRGDLAEVWPRTDPVLRLVLAQDWVWNHRHDPAIGHGMDWDAIARELASVPPEGPFWGRFSTDLVTTWHRTWRDFNTRTWSVLGKPEILELDLEMVTFAETDIGLTRRFAMRHTADGWSVASVDGDQIFEPGWPPRLRRAEQL